tara:strand:- start:473 stop:1216 length:744 start_codon:yes stop_codon:yes gene_type:complete
MANHCYNTIQIVGENKTIKKLKKKIDRYEETNFFNEFGDLILDKKFDPEEKRDGYEYGTRWFDFDVDLDDKNISKDNLICLNLSGDSAWSPPEKLIEEICKKYKVSAEMWYEEGGNDFMGETKFFWKDDVLKKEEECYSYREGMYKLSDNWHENTYEDIEDGLYSLIHNGDESYFYDQLCNLYEEYVSEKDRDAILKEYINIDTKDIEIIINHEYRKGDETETDVLVVYKKIVKIINQIIKDHDTNE